MSLKLDLILRIIAIVVICLLSTVAYVLYQADQESRNYAQAAAKSIGKQLELQLLRIGAGFDQMGRFPDLDLWGQAGQGAGLCVRFIHPNGDVVRSICREGEISVQSSPAWFEGIYQWLFRPGQETIRQLALYGEPRGSIAVTPSAGIQISRAWRDVRGMLGLAAVLVVALCVLIYVAVSRVLRPAQTIVAGLKRIEQGDLSARLPRTGDREWQRISEAINQLAISLDRTLVERNGLSLKLMNVQEQERRWLARELHDEFGQSLASINATAASISQTAEAECPKLVPEGQNLANVVGHMMEILRSMLLRLRPFELDELGLSESLNELVTGWNRRCRGTRFELDIGEGLDTLPEPVPVNLFRIVQECLTNASKHAEAARVSVRIERGTADTGVGADSASEYIHLSVEDDGIADEVSFAAKPGIGLLGMRERVAALGGRLTLQTGDPTGLVVQAWIPLRTDDKEVSA